MVSNVLPDWNVDKNTAISDPAFGQYTSPAQGQRFLQAGAVVRF